MGKGGVELMTAFGKRRGGYAISDRRARWAAAVEVKGDLVVTIIPPLEAHTVTPVRI